MATAVTSCPRCSRGRGLCPTLPRTPHLSSHPCPLCFTSPRPPHASPLSPHPPQQCADHTFTVLAELRRCGLTDSESCLKAVTLSLPSTDTVRAARLPRAGLGGPQADSWRPAPLEWLWVSNSLPRVLTSAPRSPGHPDPGGRIRVRELHLHPAARVCRCVCSPTPGRSSEPGCWGKAPPRPPWGCWEGWCGRPDAALPAANITVFSPSSFFIVVHTSLGLQLQVQLVPLMQVFLRLDPAHRGQMCGEARVRRGPGSASRLGWMGTGETPAPTLGSAVPPLLWPHREGGAGGRALCRLPHGSA